MGSEFGRVGELGRPAEPEWASEPVKASEGEAVHLR